MAKRDSNFAPDAIEQLREWVKQDKKIADKIFELIDECTRTPFTGTGQPEPLKGKEYKNFWSRRITGKHRLIYKVDDETVYIASCYGHYGDK